MGRGQFCFRPLRFCTRMTDRVGQNQIMPQRRLAFEAARAKGPAGLGPLLIDRTQQLPIA